GRPRWLSLREIPDCPGRNAEVVGCGSEAQKPGRDEFARRGAVDEARRARRIRSSARETFPRAPRIPPPIGRARPAELVASPVWCRRTFAMAQSFRKSLG